MRSRYGRNDDHGGRDPPSVDLAQRANIAEHTPTFSADVADFTSTGGPTSFLAAIGRGRGRLYRNTGARFVEVQAGTFLKRDRHRCSWADVSRDGRPDVYCTIGAGRGTRVKANELWVQQPDRSFVDWAAAFGVADPYGRGRATTFVDVNHDPYPDLFVGNIYPRADAVPSPNRLFVNMGGLTFRGAPEYGLDEEVGGVCAQAADVNGDGWQDLLVCGQTACTSTATTPGNRSPTSPPRCASRRAGGGTPASSI